MKFFKISLSVLLLLLVIFVCSESAYSQKSKQKSKSGDSKKESKLSEAKPVKMQSNEAENTVIAKVDKENITFADLEKAYRKNMNRKETRLFNVTKDSILDFLNLFINYRLKVADALNRGFEKDSAVMADIAQNRRILAESFFYDKKLVEPDVSQMLEKRNRELQIAIIVKVFPNEQNQTDTLATYNRAKKILDRILAGEDFGGLAKDSSDDKETAKTGGIVTNYITSGKTQRPIENPIFELKAGEVWNKLIRIRDGYLIVKLLKNEPRIQVKGRQILLSNGLSKDSLAVIRKADSILSLIKGGVDFSRLAEENSEDPTSAVKGGDLGAWYSRSSGFENSAKLLLPNFENALFNLKDGQTSGKIFTDYGIHIIRRDSTREFNKDADKDELKKLYKRVYFETDKREFLDNFKKTLGYTVNEPAMNEFLKAIDTMKTTLQTDWDKNVTADLKQKTLFTIDGKNITIAQLIEKFNIQRELKGTPTSREGIKNAVNKLTDPIAFDKATSNLETDYPEFSSLLNEFRDGILLFKVEAIEVWDKLKFDSTAAHAFWEKNRAKYHTLPVYDMNEVYVLSDSLSKDIYKFAKEGSDFERLAEQYTQRNGFREKKGSWGKVTTKENKLIKLFADKNPKKGDVLGPVAYENGFSVIKIHAFEPSREKTFEEAISDFAPEYQDMVQKKLTESWMTSIKQKYSVMIYDKELTDTLNKLKKQ